MGDITLKAMPFDSNEILNPATGETTFDRVAYSRDLADWLRTYISNGILVQGGDVLGSQLKVLHKEALTCTVKAGAVCINGRTGWLEADTDITVEMGGAQPRVDRVVAELNIPNDRGIYIKTLKGAPAAEPVPPNLTQTEDVYQIPLAQIKVAPASATIAEIVDERMDYISNVTIGIKPPTGNDAVTVTLSSETSSLYAVDNVDDALKRSLNLSSYMAFCGNVNSYMLDAAFGKGNEERALGLGLQLAMYAWFKGDSKITYPFTNLVKQNTFVECINNARSEIDENSNIFNIIRLSPYAKLLYYDIANWKKSYDIMSNMLSNPSLVNFIRDDTTLRSMLHNGRVLITTTGFTTKTGTYTVPEGVHTITVVCVGAGGSSNCATYQAGNGGRYIQGVLSVTPGQAINYKIGGTNGENSFFGTLDTVNGIVGGVGGNGGAGGSANQNGLLLKVASGGGVSTSGVSGGGGGFGGGNTNDLGSGGNGESTPGSAYGYGGNGYGGGGGAKNTAQPSVITRGGEGIIVLFV